MEEGIHFYWLFVLDFMGQEICAVRYSTVVAPSFQTVRVFTGTVLGLWKKVRLSAVLSKESYSDIIATYIMGTVNIFPAVRSE
jgi:hypothetical protein